MSLVFCPGNVEFVVRVAQDQQFSFDRLSVPLGTNGQPAMFDCLNVALGGTISYDNGLSIYWRLDCHCERT